MILTKPQTTTPNLLNHQYQKAATRSSAIQVHERSAENLRLAQELADARRRCDELERTNTHLETQYAILQTAYMELKYEYTGEL